MSFIDTCTEMLISAIKNGNSYRQYCAALEEIKKTPGLKEQVDELRRLNYQIQSGVLSHKFFVIRSWKNILI